MLRNSNGKFAHVSTMAINAVAGGGGSAVQQVISNPGQTPDPTAITVNAAFGGLWSEGTARAGKKLEEKFPKTFEGAGGPRGVYTLDQYSHFGSQSKTFGPNAKAVVNGAGVGGGGNIVLGAGKWEFSKL